MGITMVILLHLNYNSIIGTYQQTKHPREEDPCDMIKFACCPNFQYKSFIFIITVVDVVVFAAMLMYGGVNK